MQFLFEHIHGHIALFNGIGLLLGFGQSTLVHLLVLVERNGVNLHRDSRNHIWRLFVENEVVQSIDVDGLVAHDVSCDEFAATFFVKGLYRSILDARELADDAFHLFEFDAEATNLHLTITASHKFNIATGNISDNVASAVHSAVFLLTIEWIGDECLGGLFGAVQVAATYLRPSHPQFTRGTHGQAMPILVGDVALDVALSLANGDVLDLFFYEKVGHIANGF